MMLEEEAVFRNSLLRICLQLQFVIVNAGSQGKAADLRGQDYHH